MTTGKAPRTTVRSTFDVETRVAWLEADMDTMESVGVEMARQVRDLAVEIRKVAEEFHEDLQSMTRESQQWRQKFMWTVVGAMISFTTMSVGVFLNLAVGT